MLGKVKLKNGSAFFFVTVDKLTGANALFQILGTTMLFVGWDGTTRSHHLHEIESITFEL